MTVSGMVGEEIDKQAALASAALRNMSGAAAGPSPSQLIPRAILEMLGPFSAALYIAERVVQSSTFNLELVESLYSRLRPLEQMADDMLTAAMQMGSFDDPHTVEPLRWLETCNEQVKDCMVALESMLDPQLDEVLAASA